MATIQAGAGKRDHLAPGGNVLPGFSESGDEAMLLAEIASAGLTIVSERADPRWGYHCKYRLLAAAT